MARIKTNTSAKHLAKLVDGYKFQMYSVMERLNRDKKKLAKQKTDEWAVKS